MVKVYGLEINPLGVRLIGLPWRDLLTKSPNPVKIAEAASIAGIDAQKKAARQPYAWIRGPVQV